MDLVEVPGLMAEMMGNHASTPAGGKGNTVKTSAKGTQNRLSLRWFVKVQMRFPSAGRCRSRERREPGGAGVLQATIALHKHDTYSRTVSK